MDGLQQELLARLPLVEAVYQLFSHVLHAPLLDRVYEQHRGRSYEERLTFPVFVDLIRDALMIHHGSGRAAFDAAAARGELPVAVKNVYEKLGRCPLLLSLALLRTGVQRLAEVLPPTDDPLPASLAGLAVVAIDGKKLKKAAKRLAALWGLPGKMLAAKLLVALDLRRRLVLAMDADPDGERNDVPLVPGLLPQVRSVLEQVILWIADSQFCDLNLPALLCQQGGHFLLRYTRKLSFHPDPQRPVQEGRDRQGWRVVQEWGHVGSVKDHRRRYVRRIMLYREGEEEVILITDLLKEDEYPAEDLLDAYLQRWGIERVFQQVTETFQLQKLIGSTPQAGVFQSAFCFLMYNGLQVIGRYVAEGSGHKVEEVSTEKRYQSVVRQMGAWHELGDPAYAASYFAIPLEVPALRARLRELLGGLWRERWRKSPPKKRKPKEPKPKVQRGQAGHGSVQRAIDAYKAARQAKAGP